MRAGIFWNQNMSLLIDGLHITNDEIYALMYALFIVFKWLYIGKQSTVFSMGTSQIEPRIHFCLWQGIILRCISTFIWNWNSTFCTPGVHRTLIMYSPTRARQSVWPEFDLFDDVPSSIIHPSRPQSIVYQVPYYNVQHIQSFHTGRDSIHDWCWRLIS